MGRSFGWDRKKTEVPCHSRCGTIKIPPCSKSLSTEHRPKFCSLSPAMVTSPYKWNILDRDVKHYQSINRYRLCLGMCAPCVFPVCSLCFPCVLPVFSLCVPCVLPVFSLCAPCVFPVYSLCAPCVFPVCSLCLPYNIATWVRIPNSLSTDIFHDKKHK